MNWNDRRKSPRFNNPAVEAAEKAGSIKATSKPKRQPSNLSKKIGGYMMGTGSSNSKTVKSNRAALDAELKKGN